jgi:hypothetical protein
VVADSQARIIVAGQTGSVDFPMAGNPIQGQHAGSDWDLFVAKFDPGLENLLAATFLGSPELEFLSGIAIDSQDRLYVAGYTTSPDFPVGGGGAGATFGGPEEAFVLLLSSGLDELLASSYVGGGDIDRIGGIALAGDGSVVVAGWTYSRDLDTTGYDMTFNPEIYVFDGFVARLSGDLANWLAATYLGGDDQTIMEGVEVDGDDRVYVYGTTSASDFPVTDDAFDKTFEAGETFIPILDLPLDNLLASTFVGGRSGEFGTSLGLDGKGNVFFAETTTSQDMPVTENAYKTEFPGPRYCAVRGEAHR